MSSRPAARGSEAARSIRLALRTSSMVAVSSASPSRCFLFWPGRRARIASLIVLATVAIPPTTQPHPLPIRPHAPRRRLGCAAQETMGGEIPAFQQQHGRIRFLDDGGPRDRSTEWNLMAVPPRDLAPTAGEPDLSRPGWS